MTRRSAAVGLLLSCLIATFAAGLVSLRPTPEPAQPLPGRIAVEPPIDSRSHIFPVTLEDGTRCVAMFGAQRSGVSITCDWTTRSKP